jgi:hypothetical protein
VLLCRATYAASPSEKPKIIKELPHPSKVSITCEDAEKYPVHAFAQYLEKARKKGKKEASTPFA